MYNLKICHLYPDILNLYGDRGNIICMQKNRMLIIVTNLRRRFVMRNWKKVLSVTAAAAVAATAAMPTAVFAEGDETFK